MRSAILIFSKSAEPGLVKTRLRPILSEQQCLDLHVALLKDTIERCGAINMDTYLYLAGSGTLPFRPSIPVLQQHGIDLGERLAHAFHQQLSRYDAVITIGTDSPTLPAPRIHEAAEQLRQNDVVLGPSEDGGYYLIGLKQFLPQLFTNIPWGTAQVLSATVEAAKGFRIFLLPLCFDIDEPKDLLRLESELELAHSMEHTKAWFQNYRAR